MYDTGYDYIDRESGLTWRHKDTDTKEEFYVCTDLLDTLYKLCLAQAKGHRIYGSDPEYISRGFKVGTWR